MISRKYMDFRLARRFRQKRRALADFARKHQVPIMEDFPVNRYQSSDTVFILGSGSSINQLTDNHWQTIARHDSIGFNNWTLHPFVPNYFFFEPTSQKNNEQIRMNQQIYANIAARSVDYKNVAVIIHYLERYFFDFAVLQAFADQGNLYFQAPVNIPGDSMDELQLAYQRAYHTGYFQDVSTAVYRRGSLAKILHFALACGYKHIILMGIDLNTSPYFFDVPGVKLPDGCKGPDFTKHPHNDKLHDTVNIDLHPITMLDVIMVLNEYVIKPMGVNLYNGSESSALRSILPFHSGQ